ncbi:MAG: hypothetical protein AAFZ06_15335, partial [Pseudomonadota bacterium]
MFATNAPSPFKGSPATRQLTDAEGAPVFVVTARALTPFAAKAAHRLGLLSGVVFFGAEVWWLATALPRLEPLGWAVAAAAPFLAPTATRLGLGQLFKSERVLRISTEGVEIRGVLKTRRFPLDLPIRFSLIDHDKEKIETERLEFIKRKWGRRWWFPMPKSYLNKSCHLSLDHFDQRNDVMTIFGKSVARRIQARL